MLLIILTYILYSIISLTIIILTFFKDNLLISFDTALITLIAKLKRETPLMIAIHKSIHDQQENSYSQLPKYFSFVFRFNVVVVTIIMIIKVIRYPVNFRQSHLNTKRMTSNQYLMLYLLHWRTIKLALQ